ncbi:MAG: glycosyltransferase [Elusimicrobiota bacterium]
MIKVLFVLDCLEAGGAQRAFINLLDNLDRMRFSVSLVLVNKSGILCSRIPDNISVHNLNSRAARFALFPLIKSIKSIRPDILVSTPTYISELVFLAKKISGIKIPVIMRCANLESVNLKKESFFTRLLIKRAYASADKVIALTETMRNDLVFNFSVKHPKIEVLPNMVDIESIEKEKKERVTDEFFIKKSEIPVIITVGSLTQQKGTETLIRAFAEYRKKKQAKLVIVGDGILREELESLVSEMGVGDDVWFAGIRENPYKYIALSDVFVLPSLWEGFPNVLIEAMACRVPVITSDCIPAESRIVTGGLNGVIVPAGNAEELRDTLERVLGDFRYRTSLAEEGFKRAQDFSNKKIVRQYEDLFSSIAPDRKRRIFHLITSIDYGGTERFLEDTVMATGAEYEHKAAYLKKFGKTGIKLRDLGVEITKAHSISGVINQVKKYRPDLIHTHLYRANIIGRIAGYLLNIPVISSQRSIDLWMKWFHLKMDSATIGLCRAIITNAETTGAFLKEREKIPPGIIHVVRTGLSEEWFEEPVLGKSGRKVGIAGRLHFNKGADMIVPLAERLGSLDPAIEIKIAGTGPFSASLAGRLPGNCELSGYVAQEEIRGFYDSIDLLILLSREESFPRVVLEAAARGVPSVAPDVGGIKEFIEHGETGFIYKPGDIEEASGYVTEYFKSDRKNITGNVIKSVKTHTISRMAEDISEVYKAVIFV